MLSGSELKVFGLEQARLIGFRAFIGAFVAQRIGLGFVFVLFGVTFVALPVAVVGDIGVDMVFGQKLESVCGVAVVPVFALQAGFAAHQRVRCRYPDGAPVFAAPPFPFCRLDAGNRRASRFLIYWRWMAV